jgi:hypothetical protein
MKLPRVPASEAPSAGVTGVSPAVNLVTTGNAHSKVRRRPGRASLAGQSRGPRQGLRKLAAAKFKEESLTAFDLTGERRAGWRHPRARKPPLNGIPSSTTGPPWQTLHSRPSVVDA